jgi:thiol:disulfide interchange protein DsbC
MMVLTVWAFLRNPSGAPIEKNETTESRSTGESKRTLRMFAKFRGLALAFTALALSAAAHAQSELPAAQLATLKAKLAQRMASMPPIDSARTTPMSGLIELRVGNNVLYTDASGDFIIDGHLLDTKSQRNLTQERLDDINRIDFGALPLKDAVAWKSGTGKRRMVVFADPNCGYCKQLEREVQQLKDVTVYTFVVAILGEDSKTKAENLMCSANRTQAWLDWMLRNQAPPRAMGMCNNPIQRNQALMQKFGINGTPAIFFEDGSRLPGAASKATIEQRLDRPAKSG